MKQMKNVIGQVISVMHTVNEKDQRIPDNKITVLRTTGECLDYQISKEKLMEKYGNMKFSSLKELNKHETVVYIYGNMNRMEKKGA